MISSTETRIAAALAALCLAAAVTAGPASADAPYGIGITVHPVTFTATNPGTSVRDAPMGLGSAGHGTPVRTHA